jgi:hypothetical protein
MTAHQIHTIGSEQATRLTPPGTHSGMDITLQNVNNSGEVYLGGEGVSSSSYGFRLMPGHAFSIELPGRDALYAIADRSDMQIAILQTSLESQD